MYDFQKRVNFSASVLKFRIGFSVAFKVHIFIRRSGEGGKLNSGNKWKPEIKKYHNIHNQKRKIHPVVHLID